MLGKVVNKDKTLLDRHIGLPCTKGYFYCSTQKYSLRQMQLYVENGNAVTSKPIHAVSLFCSQHMWSLSFMHTV